MEPITASSGNVFADLGFEPEEAENLRLRAQLLVELERTLDARVRTQAEAALLLGVQQPRISDIVRGRVERFSLDALVNMLAKLGRHVHIEVS